MKVTQKQQQNGTVTALNALTCTKNAQICDYLQNIHNKLVQFGKIIVTVNGTGKDKSRYVFAQFADTYGITWADGNPILPQQLTNNIICVDISGKAGWVCTQCAKAMSQTLPVVHL